MTVPNPWTELAREGDLILLRLPIADWGRYYHEQRAIVIRSGIGVREERAVLWHELVHARRGDRGCGDMVLSARVEARVDREAARLAIPLGDLAAALRWTRDPDELAEELKTTTRLLRVRAADLDADERARLRDEPLPDAA